MNRYTKKFAFLSASLCTALVVTPGCGTGFLSLEDYQRDLIFGGLAIALLSQQPQGGTVEQPIPGADGASCWDLNGNGIADDNEDVNGDGVVDTLDCQGAAGAPGRDGEGGTGGGSGLNCWDINGNGTADSGEDTNGDGVVNVFDCRGDAGADGANGGSGSSGSPGADGPAFFDVFIDDFFTEVGDTAGSAEIGIVPIDAPILGIPGGAHVAFRVAIPARYQTGNDVTLRLFFHRTGPFAGDCFVFTLDAVRLRNGFGIETYGGRRWVRVDLAQSDDNGGASGVPITDPGVGVVVDIPINTPAGLGFPNDEVDGLAAAHFLAIELGTDRGDGGAYQLLGAEFIESSAGSATRRGATVFDSADTVSCGCVGVGPDCNDNGQPDDCEIELELTPDCNGNGVPDECDICDIVTTAGVGTWPEAGDAGDLPAGAQSSVGVGSLQSISGTVSSGDDVDMYRIRIVGGGTFSASTVSPDGSANFDTQLFLFDANGIGVYTNDDSTGDSPWTSLLPAGHSLTPTTGGIYYLAISGWQRDPVSPDGAIFPNPDNDPGVFGPTGPGGGSAVNGWKVAGETGQYTIALTGAEFAEGDCSDDCNADGIPDECEIDGNDCNENGTLDVCDITSQDSNDCNANGIPDECEVGSTKSLTQIDFVFDSTPPTSWDYEDSDDDNATGTIALPFSVRIGSETFTHFEQDSNGYVELLRAGESPYGESYGDVAELIASGDPHHTFLMAAYDDLSSYYYGEYGYRIQSDRVTFYWNTETYDDDDDGYLNTFQIILHADGRVQWNFDRAEYNSWSNDLFSGLYLGHTRQELFEIYRDFIPVNESWLYAEGGGEGDCNGNGVPDECDIRDCGVDDPACADCNENEIPDECEGGDPCGEN